MNIFRILALVLAVGGAAAGAHAQEQAGQEQRVIVVVEPDAGLEQRLILARELLSLSAGPNFAKEFERAMSEQIAKLGEQGGEQAAWVQANMPPMLARMASRLLDQMALPYARTYTEEELREQIAFYSTPVGQAVAAKSISLGVAIQQTQAEVVMGFLTEFQSKYCAQFGCDAAGGQAAAKPGRR